eukprot:3941360-Amphidinium_carterae.2
MQFTGRPGHGAFCPATRLAPKRCKVRKSWKKKMRSQQNWLTMKPSPTVRSLLLTLPLLRKLLRAKQTSETRELVHEYHS